MPGLQLTTRLAGVRSGLGDAALLREAGADLVVTSLDEVAVDRLTDGLSRKEPA